MSKPNRIFIVGQMGAGKSLVAEALANKLGWQFIDADFGLEHRFLKSCGDILGNEGEASLHHNESKLLSNLLKRENLVINTDGAVLTALENQKLLSSEFVVYLQVSTPVQIERLQQSPFTIVKADSEYKTLLDSLHQQRDKSYEQVANVTVNTDDGKLNNHVQEILDALGPEKFG